MSQFLRDRGPASPLRLPAVQLFLVFGLAGSCGIAGAAELSDIDPELPTLFIAGDSTAAQDNPRNTGWGEPFAAFFDPARVNVVNCARGGRSSRTFITEGLWDRLVAEVKAGDIVLIQFGHNDGGAINDDRRARGSLPGLGEETRVIENQVTKKREMVHTFGWYMRRMIADVRAKDAHPALLSLTVRNIWQHGRVERGSGNFGAWTREIAAAEGVPFVDATTIIADRYEELGSEHVAAFFPRDHTHTNAQGAALNAESIVAGLKSLDEPSVRGLLSEKGRRVPAADEAAVALVQSR